MKNIYIPLQDGIRTLIPDEIIYLETYNNITVLYYKSGETENIEYTVGDIEMILFDKGFFRFNYKCIVNLKYVQMVLPDNSSKVILENGKEIFVTQNRRAELYKSLEKMYEMVSC